MAQDVELIGWDDDMEAYVGDDGGYYEVGDDGAVYDLDDEIGARGRRRRRARRSRRRERRRGPELKPAPKNFRLSPTGPAQRMAFTPSSERRQILGIGTTVPLAAGASVTVQTNVQRDFQGQRLILSALDTVAGTEVNFAVTLTAFLIGSSNQLPSGNPISLIAFRADSIASQLELTPATVGTIVSMTFANGAANPVSIGGGIYGITR